MAAIKKRSGLNMLVMIARLAENQYQKSKLKGIFYHLHISCIVQANSDSKPLGVGIGLDNCSSALAWTMQLSGAWHVGTGGNTQQTVFINTYRLWMIFGKAGEKVLLYFRMPHDR